MNEGSEPETKPTETQEAIPATTTTEQPRTKSSTEAAKAEAQPGWF